MFYQLVEDFNGRVTCQADMESGPEDFESRRNGNKGKQVDKIACHLSKLVELKLERKSNEMRFAFAGIGTKMNQNNSAECVWANGMQVRLQGVLFNCDIPRGLRSLGGSQSSLH